MIFKKEYRIFKLELTCKIFKGDANYILRENRSSNKKKEKARLYWNQNITDNPIYEYLFVGTATIVEEIKDYKCDRKSRYGYPVYSLITLTEK